MVQRANLEAEVGQDLLDVLEKRDLQVREVVKGQQDLKLTRGTEVEMVGQELMAV